MKSKKLPRGIKLTGILLLFFFLLVLESAPIKIRVIVDNASIKATPEIGGNTIAKVPLNTILESEEKQGEWYKVYVEKEGLQIAGFIHEMLIEVFQKEELTRLEDGVQAKIDKPQAEIVAEIEIKMEENRKLIRQEKDFEDALHSLKPLIAKAFRVVNNKRQKELASEVYLWIGLAYAGRSEEYFALREFENMFEVNHPYAKEITRNIYDPEVIHLIQHAEKKYLGLVTDYSLEILTEPKEAKIIINGEEIGLSPEVYITGKPKFTIEIEKEGFKSVKDEIFLTRPSSEKEYFLERIGRNVDIKSNPSGAKVFLDDEDMKKITNCRLNFVSFGIHNLHLIKENYAEWEKSIDIKEDPGPFAVEAVLTVKNYSFINKWGGPYKKNFYQPEGITIDNGNNIYILDMSDRKIKKFNSEGKLQINWGRRGKEFKSLKNPSGIAVDSRGYLYVTDARSHCVMKFDKVGIMIKKWGKEGSRAEELRSPSGIAVDHNNDIYVADSFNNHIKKYSPLGVLKKIWGKQGVSDGNFVFPTAIAASQKDEIFVLDRTRVQKFSSEGEFIASWGKIGAGDGEFNKPKGIFIDMDNYVYVADSANNRIQKFDENGKFITKWGSRGIDNGLMKFPCGLVIDNKGYVYVVERDNNRIQVFGITSQSKS